jgi:cytochrome c553
MNKLIIAVIVAGLSSPVLAKGNAAAGEAKAKEVCAACHGPAGNMPTTPDFPKLAGQHYDYLLHSLKAYKSGERKNPIMAGQVQPLSVKGMEDLAAYYAAQQGSLGVKR